MPPFQFSFLSHRLLQAVLLVAWIIAHPVVAQDAPCYTAVNGDQICGQKVLPPGVCLSQQGDTGASRANCNFKVRDPEFMEVLGADPKLELIGFVPAHEGGVYFPDREEFYFSSTWTSEDLDAKLLKLSLVTNEVTTVLARTHMANGMVLDKTGALLICEQGWGAHPGYIERLNLFSMDSSVVADNWQGHPFNSPNDAIVKSDGSIWFTDPDYGWTEGFKGAPRINNQVYRISPSGVVTAVAEGFVKPNGLTFSQDEKLLYVTDTGSSIGNGSVDETKPHSISVFDVSEDGTSLSNRRLFQTITSFDGSYKGNSAPDGIKVDTNGRVYTANLDGVQVFNAQGKLLGLISVPGAVNMGFAGKKLDRMLILNGTTIHSVVLQVQGAGLFYAEQHMHS